MSVRSIVARNVLIVSGSSKLQYSANLLRLFPMVLSVESAYPFFLRFHSTLIIVRVMGVDGWVLGWDRTGLGLTRLRGRLSDRRPFEPDPGNAGGGKKHE